MSFREFYTQQEISKYKEFVDLLTEASHKAGASLKRVGNVGDEFELFRVDVNPKAKKTILIGATIHGNEQSGAYGVVDYLKEYSVPTDVRLIILPLMNPHGFVKDVRSATNRADLNRAFRAKEFQNEGKLIRDTLEGSKIDFLISLHEDGDADGFYIYFPEGKPTRLLNPLKAIASKHFPVLDDKKEFRGESMEDGIIVMADDNKMPHNVKSFEFWVRKNNDNCPYLCTEVPTKFPLKDRVACVSEMVNWSVTKLFPKISDKE
jgi:hypothetical protein